jgi:hypothetical protein
LLNLKRGFDDTSCIFRRQAIPASHKPELIGIFQIDFPGTEKSRTVTLVGQIHLRNP